jgi:osmotically-inducible protein OsmY
VFGILFAQYTGVFVQRAQHRRRSTMFTRFISGFLVAATLSIPAAVIAKPAVDADSRALASDRLIADRIGEQVRRYVFYTIFDDVQGRVENGLVTLSGKVTAPYKAKAIGEFVKRIPGVREVDNKIETLPVSMFDDELRAQIATSIYRDPAFWNYAIQVNPPIHVIVDHGHVTLTGVVGSEVERRMAEVKAREAFGSFSVENKLSLERDMRNSN